ncbi:MAG: class SAM-dependent methyltransferase [Actinomycetia bacterium]|nr:class SAM-dependent methyltransferase [Actinomycetes bacterium]
MSTEDSPDAPPRFTAATVARGCRPTSPDRGSGSRPAYTVAPLDASPALIDRLLADPPAVHAMQAGDDPEIGIWSTDRDCYLLLAEHAGPDTHTLETGSGVSTVLFAALGARHTCVTPAQAEADRILGYCAEKGIDTSSLTFEIGCSDDVLPRLSGGPSLDLVLIDGNHGYPTPMLDWYYAGSRLRRDGILVLDDIVLPAVAHMCAFLDRDPRFAADRRTEKWAAYRRVTDGDLRQDWFEQPFYTAPAPSGLAAVPGRALRKIRRTLPARRP